MENTLFEVTQQIVLKNKADKVLILNKGGKWMLPGGRVKKNEKWNNALVREVKEETGIDDFQIDKIIDVATAEYTDDNSQFIITFAGSTDKEEVKLSSEHQEFAWIDFSEIDSYDFWHPAIKERILKAK